MDGSPGPHPSRIAPSWGRCHEHEIERDPSAVAGDLRGRAAGILRNAGPGFWGGPFGRPRWWWEGAARLGTPAGLQGTTDAPRRGAGLPERRGSPVGTGPHPGPRQQRSGASQPGSRQHEQSFEPAPQFDLPGPGAPRLSPEISPVLPRGDSGRDDAAGRRQSGHDSIGQGAGHPLRQFLPEPLHLRHRDRGPHLPGLRLRARLPQPLLRRPGTVTAGRRAINRAIVSRLRSVHTSLARIDHDYQGHRVRAMHAISMAIRQLSHRSMVYSGVGFASGMNNGMGMGGWVQRDAAGAAHRRWRRTRGPGHAPGAVRRPDEPGPAEPAGDRHAAQQPGVQHHGSCPGARTRPAGDPRAEHRPCRSAEPECRRRRRVRIGLPHSSPASSDLEIKSPFSATSIK